MSERTDATILTEQKDDVFIITLNRPHVLNAMTLAMFDELAAAIREAAESPQVKIVVLTGAGGHFCSGADLRVLGTMSDEQSADSVMQTINGFLAQLHTMNKPVIALIRGAAVGAGLNLALHADFVLVAEDAVLQEPFVQLGLTTDFGGTNLLPKLVGMASAKRLALLGERITGREAEQIGLVYKAVAATDLEQEAEQLIATLKRIPLHAYAKTKQGLMENAGQPLEKALAWEAEEQPKLILNPVFQTLVQAKLARSST